MDIMASIKAFNGTLDSKKRFARANIKGISKENNPIKKNRKIFQNSKNNTQENRSSFNSKSKRGPDQTRRSKTHKKISINKDRLRGMSTTPLKEN